ncbi:pyridoxal phosphate-dependent aminotransferase [Jannaschia seohaensis]|uniref:Aminotransferase n=1 Tax=Jannaschia seohaensis TaxID=475081 RepID=A0A2Y9AQC6_9RHOB|nr:pyridoxal phosphate-dependent aminotransferase [Jannaschia seohaensis]PWJ20463.1 arginine:pyruvate transaminase [Jannaschia seohaensis]SSA44559.1 arginine:pyruvate transaminase [Jannaschia seohaensis]
MARMSDRIRSIAPGGDDGWGIFHAARALEEAGVEIVNLTVGDHDIRTDPAILAAMDDAARGGATGYAALHGIPELRTAIAKRVQERTGVATSPANVLVTTGGQAALFYAVMGAAEPGERVLYPDPYYATYPGTVRAAGAVPLVVPTRAEAGFQPERSSLEAAGEAAAILINSPNNPTGAIYSRDTLDTLAEVARAGDMWVISDEVYDTQIWSGAHLTPRALPGMDARTLVVGSMSKSHAMTGSRIGWLVGPEDAIEALSAAAVHTTYGVAGFVQAAALFALGLGPDFETRVAAPFAARRDVCLAALERTSVRAVPSGGAMYLMLDIRASVLDAPAFAARLLDEKRIAAMPGDSFGRAAEGHLRIALTRPEAELTAAIAQIANLVEETRP